MSHNYVLSSHACGILQFWICTKLACGLLQMETRKSKLGQKKTHFYLMYTSLQSEVGPSRLGQISFISLKATGNEYLGWLCMWGSRIVVPKLGKTSSDFADFMTQNGIRHIRVASYHPSCNGLVKQVVQSLRWRNNWQVLFKLNYLISFFTKDWHHTQLSTGIPLAELLLAKRPWSLLNLLLANMKDQVKQQQEQQKVQHDKHSSQCKFNQGDSVLIHNFSARTEHNGYQEKFSNLVVPNLLKLSWLTFEQWRDALTIFIKAIYNVCK